MDLDDFDFSFTGSYALAQEWKRLIQEIQESLIKHTLPEEDDKIGDISEII